MKERPFGASNHLILLVQFDLLTRKKVASTAWLF
jgi:hypothetical protein